MDSVKQIKETDKAVLIFGAGTAGKFWFSALCKKFEIIGFIDNNPQKQKEEYLGLPVYSVENFKSIKANDIAVIICLGDMAEKANVITQMEQCGLKHNETLFDIKDFLKKIPDDEYLRMMYRIHMKKELNLDNPQTFNEKLQWLKLYDRKPEYTAMADKYEVRKFVAEKIGEEYLIPLLGVWDRFEDIDFNKLPNQFVLKCNHDSGSVVICKDKNTFDLEAAKTKLNNSLTQNYYYFAREWPYKNIKPRIIAEKYMVDESGVELKDYKMFCFNGEPKYIQVDFDRFIKHKRNIYDTEWNYIPVSVQYPTDPEKVINKPSKLGEMLSLARILSKNIPHVRVDFYHIENAPLILFAEFAFYNDAGFGKFGSLWDRKFGECIGRV
jgi:hypothetical protein